MTLNDYMYSSNTDKGRWLDSFRIVTGLPYFGGKKFIGKALVNHICNMAERIYMDGNNECIFVDAFAGGGKIALSMPRGWFHTVVLNDINYGVYNFFLYCKEKPKALIKMIEELGSVMSKDFFDYCINNRSNPTTEPLASAAMTYWVAHSSFLAILDPERAGYKLGTANQGQQTGINPVREREDIRNIISLAGENIIMIHNRMKELNVVVENLDYRNLIKKYNGKNYTDASKRECESLKNMDKAEKLWYYDPPYHPATLCNGQAAPYEDEFDINEVKEMTKILHGDRESEFGRIGYFIKSDYSPREEYEIEKEGNNDPKRINQLQNHVHDYDVLEENIEWQGHKPNKVNPVFYREFLGEFHKGGMDDVGIKAKGREYIWCRGNYIPEE